MAGRSGKEVRKQKKKHEERRRRAELQQQYQQQNQPQRPGPEPPQPSAVRPAVSTSANPARPVRERTPTDDWWDDYSDADGQGRLQMLREKLELVQPGDDWYPAIIPDAIDDLENSLSAAEYVAFLEELRVSRPDVFAESMDWHTRSMALFYVASQRWEDLDRAVEYFADRLTKVDEPLFSLMSLVRLAGRSEPAQKLIDAVMSPDVKTNVMPWAFEELLQWALFAKYQTCVRAGATEEAIEQLHQSAVESGCGDSKEARQARQDFALHLAGKGTTWSRDVFVRNDRLAMRRIHLLTVDCMRWLCANCGFQPMVADELRTILISTLYRTECKPTVILRGLRRLDLEPAIAGKLDFLSLDRHHAPAAIIAIRHFYDFLVEAELVQEKDRDAMHAVCDELWRELKTLMEDAWQSYAFLEPYLPRTQHRRNETG